MKLTKEFVAKLREAPLTDEEKELIRLEDEWFEELSRSGLDGTYECLEPYPDVPSLAEEAAIAAGWTPPPPPDKPSAP